MSISTQPFILINVFTPKPGKLDEFVALQVASLPNLSQGAGGARGGRLYRAEDGSRAVLERSEPTRYELVYEMGGV